MQDKLVRDVMVPLEEYPHVTVSNTLREAVQEIGKFQILRRKRTSLPRVALVFDDGFSEIQGILRRRDIMRGLEPRFLTAKTPDVQEKYFEVEIDSNLSEMSHDKIADIMQSRSVKPVKEFMSPIKATVNADDHIMKAVYEMVDRNTSLLPVLEGEGVVGVIRSVDALFEIALIIAKE
ncbi:MAG: CBS domain-containing protein [Planctomycetota bacterium]|jgi:CBS domain-containing protein